MKRVFMNGILFTLVSIVWFSFGSVTVHAADDILGGVPAEYDQRLQFHIDWTDSSYAEGNVYHSSYADFVLGFKSSEDIVAWVDNTEKGPLRFAPFSQLEKDNLNNIHYASAYVISAAQDDAYSSWPKDKNVGLLWNSPLLLYPAISSNTIDCNCTYTADFPIFDSFESARRYYESNKEDTSGMLNKPDTDSFYLTGFDCDDTVHATWTDIVVPSDSWNLNEVNVSVSCSYLYLLGQDEELVDFPKVGTIEVPYTNFSFDKSLSDYYKDNPYDGKCILTLTFVPVYKGMSGKEISVSFDVNKKMSINLPQVSLTPVYNENIYFENFSSNSNFKLDSQGGTDIFARWTGVHTGEIEYIYSDVKIDLYCCNFDSYQTGGNGFVDMDWFEYNTGDILSFNTRKLEFNVLELRNYIASLQNNYNFGNPDSTYTASNYAAKIRITPYCKTSTNYYYGKSVEITLSQIGNVKSIMQNEGASLSVGNLPQTNLDFGYFDDNSVIGDLTESILNKDESVALKDIDGLTLDFFALLKAMLKTCGQFPALVGEVFSFLPQYYSNMLVIGLGLIILLRILGR